MMMWGICLDNLIDGGNLYQKVVEYQLDSDNHIAHILQPAKDKKVSINDSNFPQGFIY